MEEGDELVRVAAVTAVDAVELYRFFHAGDDEVRALRGVSLTVHAGEFVGIMGPSGSGKSTLLACLAGLDDPDGGTVRIDGERMSRRPERHRTALRARRIGIVLQSSNLVDHLTIRANVRLASRLVGGDADPNDLLGRVGLGKRTRAVPSQLSGGEAVRAAVAVALTNQPSVVIADEPTAEVDRHTEAGLLDLLRAEVDRGVALVVATHSPVVAAAADRVIELRDGRVVE